MGSITTITMEKSQSGQAARLPGKSDSIDRFLTLCSEVIWNCNCLTLLNSLTGRPPREAGIGPLGFDACDRIIYPCWTPPEPNSNCCPITKDGAGL